MNWETSKPLVIAHRGWRKQHHENTLGAFVAAVELGVDGIETDLRMTRDGELVVFHDRDPEKMTLAEVRERCLPDGSRIPTFGELLETIRGRCLINLEIKNRRIFTAEMERKVLRGLEGYPKETVLFSSFHPLTLLRLRRIAPTLPRGQLFTPRQRFYAPLLSPLLRPFSVHIPLASLTPGRVARAHGAGRRVFVWTVNREDDMKRCLDLRVDGIITDDPERCRGILG